jgi:hypothetical protein
VLGLKEGRGRARSEIEDVHNLPWGKARVVEKMRWLEII